MKNNHLKTDRYTTNSMCTVFSPGLKRLAEDTLGEQPVRDCRFCGKRLPVYTKAGFPNRSKFCKESHRIAFKRRQSGRPLAWRGVRRPGL